MPPRIGRRRVSRRVGYPRGGVLIRRRRRLPRRPSSRGWPTLLRRRRGRPYAFELLGYDFLVDEGLTTWLIEVNEGAAVSLANTNSAGIPVGCIDAAAAPSRVHSGVWGQGSGRGFGARVLEMTGGGGRCRRSRRAGSRPSRSPLPGMFSAASSRIIPGMLSRPPGSPPWRRRRDLDSKTRPTAGQSCEPAAP